MQNMKIENVGGFGMSVPDIQIGDIALTKQKDEESWITNSVVNFNEKESIIELTLKSELLESLKGKKRKGDLVEIKVAKEEYIYIISGTVKEIITDFPDRIKVRIDTLNKLKNNRAEIRYDVWLSSVIRGQDIDILEPSLVTNISRSGMAILSEQNLTIDSEIFIDVQLGDAQVVRLKGKPIRKRANGYRIEYGISSMPIDESNSKIFNDYLMEIEEKNNSEMSIIKKIRAKSETVK